MDEDIINEEFLDQATEISYDNFKQQREDQHLDPNQIKDFKQKYMKPLYPYTYQTDGSKRKYYCCQTCYASPGSFFCCDSTPPDKSYLNLGMAICLLMKFIKHSNIAYLFLSILAITSCVVCFMVAVQNDFTPTDNYTKFFFSTSYGSFSAQHNKCSYQKIDTTTQQASFSLSCPYGKINASVTTSVLPIVLTNESLNSLFNCRNERKKLIENSNLAEPYLSILSSKTVTYSDQNSKAAITLTFNGSQTQSQASFVYECYDNTYNLGKLQTESKNFFYYVVAVDLAICLFFFVFFCSEIKAEQKEAEYFKKNEVSLNDFSVQVWGLKRNTLEKELFYLLPYLSRNWPDFLNSIVAISIPEIPDEVDQREDRRALYNKFYNLINKYYFKDFEKIPSYREAQEIIEKQMDGQTRTEFRRKLKKYTYQMLTMKRREILKDANEDMQIYMVFDNVNVRNRMMELQQSNCCVDKLTYIDQQGQQKQYLLRDPPVPDKINWQNRYKWTKLRTLISWVFVILIIVGCYLLLGYIQYRQSELNKQYNYDIDCNVIFPGVDFTIYNSTLASSSSSKEYETCYCKDKSLFNVVSQAENTCRNWQREYIIYMAIPLLLSLAIVILNVIVGQIFRLLTMFEKQKDTEKSEISYAFKRGFLLMMNMGLVMILLNINYNNSTQLQEVSFIFLGKFDDFTSDWYYQIGAILILTMIFNIAFSLIEAFLACSLRCFKKCWDTRCCTKITSQQTKQEYIELHSDQIYPFGERYAYLMATFMISMAFCGVIPILIPVTFLSFFLLYFADKVLILKYYRKPLQYTSSLHHAFIIVLYISLTIHFGLTAFFLAEPTLINKDAYISSTTYYISSSNQRIGNIFKTAYILPYVVIFILMVLYAVLRKFLCGTFIGCLQKCARTEINYKSEVLQNSKLFNLLSPQQRDVLRVSLQIKLNQVQFKKKEKTKHNILSFPCSGFDEEESNRPDIEFLFQEEQIIKKVLEKLTECDHSRMNEGKDWGQKLLGLPSYEECVHSNQQMKDEKMIMFEKNLKSLVSHAHSKPPKEEKAPEDNNNNTASNLFDVPI